METEEKRRLGLAAPRSPRLAMPSARASTLRSRCAVEDRFDQHVSLCVSVPRDCGDVGVG